jgi:branched-chain amino acid transport system substrate-binding protein
VIVRRLLALALTLALGLPLAASSAEPSPVEIPVVISLTGSFAFQANSAAKAFALVEDATNKEGGIRGRPVKFVLRDDQTSPQVAVQLVGQAIASKAPLIVAGMVVALCSAPMALIKTDGPLLYCFSPGVHPAPGSWIFSMSFSTLNQIPGAMRFINLRNLKKIAIITTTDATGQEADSTLANTLALPENKDITVVDREHLNGSDMSAAAQMTHVQASGAQAVIVWMSGTPLGTVLHAMHDIGLDIPVITTGGNLTYTQMEAYKSVMPAQDLFLMGIPAVDGSTVRDRAVARAIDTFQRTMRANGLNPDGGTAYAWDTARLIVDAYRRAGPDATPAQLRDAINATTMTGIYGHYDFKAAPQRGIQPYWLMVDRWDPGASKFVAVTKPGDLFPLGAK